VQHVRIGFCQTGRQKIRLFLVVAFEADTIFRPDHRLEQRGGVVCRHHLSPGELAPSSETFVARSLLDLRISHLDQHLKGLSHLAFLLLFTYLTAGLGFNRFNGLGSR
jgi:hypothetical protein